jgi:DNA repair exonuclease SbcCD ATPase subunit
MAVKVRVKNFQSIKDTEIMIDGLTAITGTNNTGKSSLFRAILGVFQNTRGTKFVRHGADKCSVELVFDDGRSVKWEKGDKIKPTYILDGDEDHPIYPGQGVPDEVKALGFHSIQAGSREVWPQIARQLVDQVFLLDEPGSVLAEAVANVDRVGRLNRALKSSERDRRRASSELKVRLSDRIGIEEELAQYKGLDAVQEKVEEIEALARQAARMERAHTCLVALRDRLGRARSTVGALEGIEGVVIPEKGDAEEALGSLERHQALQGRLKRAREGVARYDGMGEIDHEVDVSSAEKVLTTLAGLLRRKSKIEGAFSQVDALEQECIQKGRELRAAEEEVREILGDLGECPVCGTVTGEHEHGA